MKVRMIFLSVLFFTAFGRISPLVAHAATYYVAKTGNNNNTCTKARSLSTPKHTIAAGLSCLSGGDTLIIKAGTYLEAINYKQVPSGISDSKRTIVKGATGETVTLRPSTGGATGDVIRIWGHRYVTYDSLVVDGVNVTRQGVRIQNSSSQVAHHITLQNMEIKNAGKNCVLVQNDNTYIRLLDSKIHNCGGSSQDHGIYLTGSNNLIEGNEIYDNSGHGVHQYLTGCSTCDNNIISYNYIHGNVSRGILIGSGDNNIAHHNISANNGADGISIGFGVATNNKAYNNTISGNSDYCIEVRNSSTGAVVRNNLCLSNANNTIFNSGRGSVIANNRLSTDTSLVTDAVNNLYTPPDSSSLIDAGDNISGFSDGKFLGLAPDHGAIEFGANLVDYDSQRSYGSEDH
jgi:parallel beta-helix repeat protein